MSTQHKSFYIIPGISQLQDHLSPFELLGLQGVVAVGILLAQPFLLSSHLRIKELLRDCF